MNHHPRRQRPHDVAGDDGSVTLFLAITVLGLLVLVGLVVDGGAKIRAVQRADQLAAEAARAGGQAINVPAAITGEAPTLDARAAVAAAQAFLRRNGAQGTAAVTNAGQSLEVTVTATAPTVFLGLVGIDSMTVRGHAHATLVRGVTGAAP
ncbi:MAG: pilus assembly protein TadG-related protein [Actinobacteria bacterium]|nr:pilus assembly protein TadG-related protein [Actinomycetota bacterium]